MIETGIGKDRVTRPRTDRPPGKAIASGVFGTLKPPAKKPAAKPPMQQHPNLP